MSIVRLSFILYLISYTLTAPFVGRFKLRLPVIYFAGQQQQFHAFAFGQRPFLAGHFGNPLDPLQRAAADPLAFRMPSIANCQSKY